MERIDGRMNFTSYLASDHCLNGEDVGSSVVLQNFARQHVADPRVEPHQFTLENRRLDCIFLDSTVDG